MAIATPGAGHAGLLRRHRKIPESGRLWAVERLKRSFFAKDPSRILDVWLFKDARSYYEHARALFHDTPDTPYGYYSPEHGALIMNISTGGGTLVHEIVHPFMEANFPDCPAWFNEGLGSLMRVLGNPAPGLFPRSGSAS